VSAVRDKTLLVLFWRDTGAKASNRQSLSRGVQPKEVEWKKEVKFTDAREIQSEFWRSNDGSPHFSRKSLS
jgi:hypothetical protein